MVEAGIEAPPAGPDPPAGASPDDLRLVEALKAGDERAFSDLLTQYHSSLIRVAMMYVSSRAVAEEVVQETWVGVIKGLARFEGRSSLKTWIYRILTNTAKTRAEREGRTIPFSSLAGTGEDDDPAVDPDRFLDGSHPTWSGHWDVYPRSWSEMPEQRLLGERDSQPDRGGGRSTSGDATDGHPPSRHRGLLVGRGLLASRHLRGQSARASPPGALEGAREIEDYLDQEDS